MRLRGVVLGMAAASVAGAANARAVPERGRTVLVPHEVSGRAAEPRAEPGSRVIYVNGCWDGGCTLQPETDADGEKIEDSRRNYSSILSAPVTLPEYPYGRDSFDEVIACMRRLYAPFDVSITTEDPGDAPHWEHVLTGTPSQAGFPINVLGVSPYDRETCQTIPNAITYAFAASIEDDTTALCEIAAQEIAHAFGLDHEYLCRDPMTYLPPCGPKSFQDEDAACGERSRRPCHCGETQNSYRMILDQFGARTPTPPAIELVSHADGDRVGDGYTVRFAIDEPHIDVVEVRLNSRYVERFDGADVAMPEPPGISDGVHRFRVVALDQYGARTEVAYSLVKGDACEGSGDCRDADVCVDGRCVPGSGVEGGLGAACSSGAECKSDACVLDSEGDDGEEPSGTCVEPCEPGGAAGGCPGGFRCERAGGDGPVCWPEGGCAAAAGDRGSALPLAVGLALALGLARRRRARPRSPSTTDRDCA